MPLAADALYIPPQLRTLDIRASMYVFEDFAGGSATPSVLQALDVSPAGAPAAQASAAGGQFLCQNDATNEVKSRGLWQNDVLTWPIGWGIVWATRIRPTVLPAAVGSISLMGLASARNATPGTVAEKIWFIASANANLMFQMDDTVTDTGLVDTGLDLVVGAYYTLVIDTRHRSNVRLWGASAVNTALSPILNANTYAYAAASTGLFQILVESQSTDAAIPGFAIDWVGCWAERALDTQVTVYPAYT